jgi:3-deoxy-D-manno-octulosonate 8-phosphate phosphatase (KDO 8-P phosphatase)
MVRPLSDSERSRRAERIRLVLTDVDGVLTDAGVYYSERGEELRRFSVRDGMGVELLREAGIATAFLSREHTPMLEARARKLQLPHVFLGVRDKAAALGSILETTACSLEQVAYIGDDVNDLALLLRVGELGIAAAPADAVTEVRRVVHFCTAAVGGSGAFRELSDSIIGRRKEAYHP